MKYKNISAFLLISSVFTGLSLNIDSASAASLVDCLVPTDSLAPILSTNNPGTASGDYLFNQGTDKDAFKSDCGVTDLGVVEGRAGTAGNTGDYEVGIGLNGAQADLADQLQLDWVDDVVYNWTLDWNPDTNIATFAVGGDSIDYDFDLSSSQTLNLDRFNAFGIQARADNPSQYISENTTLSLEINSITFDPLDGDPSVTENYAPGDLAVSAISSTSSDSIVDEFYTINIAASELASSDSEITFMSGTFSMDIPDGGVNPQDESARSRIGFQILLFDPPPESVPESTPEPASIISLLALGTLGLIRFPKKD